MRTAMMPYERDRYKTVDPPSVRIAGSTSRLAAPSSALTMSTMKLRGRAIMISDLHCGQRIFFGRPVLETSRSATQSNKQDSWAVRAHGQGLRHEEERGVSSVSSEKHIQQRLISFGSCAGMFSFLTADCDDVLVRGREAFGVDGSSRTVSESWDSAGWESCSAA